MPYERTILDTDLPFLDLALGLPVVNLDTDAKGIVINNFTIHPECILVLFDDEDEYTECGDGSTLRPRLDTRLGFLHVLTLWHRHVHECFYTWDNAGVKRGYGIRHAMTTAKLWELATLEQLTDEDRDNLAGHVCAWKAK